LCREHNPGPKIPLRRQRGIDHRAHKSFETINWINGGYVLEHRSQSRERFSVWPETSECLGDESKWINRPDMDSNICIPYSLNFRLIPGLNDAFSTNYLDNHLLHLNGKMIAEMSS
jgi:hypothetical protein